MSRHLRRLRVLSLTTMALLLFTACDAAPAPTASPIAAPAAPAASTATTAGAAASTATTAPPAPAAGAGPAFKNPDTLVVSSNGELATLDPAWAYDVSSAEVIGAIYEPLLAPKREKTSEFVGVLATKWDLSADGKTYTFTIRKGVKFHNGEDLTPEDVAYSFQRGMMQDRAGGPQWILLQPFFGLSTQSFKGDIVEKQFNKDWSKACAAVKNAVTFDNAANTVTMHLKQPYGPMLQILVGTWGSVLSKAWVAKQGGWDGDCATAEKHNDPKQEESELFKVANGTGPFKLDRWATGEQISLVRNDNYWLKEPLWAGGPSGPAKIARIVIKYVKEWGTRFAAFKAGDADILNVDPQYISQMEPLVKETCEYGKDCAPTHPNGFARVFTRLPSPSNTIIGLNQLVNVTGGNNRVGSGKLDGKGIPADFFADIHVRKAMNYCFDWKTLIAQVFSGEAEQNYGPVVDGELGYDPNQPHYALDLAKCADEFKAATLKSADGKSLWDTGFVAQFVYTTGDASGKAIAEILQTNVAKVNSKFQISLAEEPFAEEINEIQSGRLPFFNLGWVEDFHDPHDWVFPYLAGSGAYSGSQHFPKALQDQLDTLIAQAVSSTDTAERVKLYQQLQNMAYENALDVFLDQPQWRHYEQSWIHGWYWNPLVYGSNMPGSYFYGLTKGP
jgi:peptide/nickel transport system substrate-binding protein